jgi:hypothetical protein
MFWLCTGCLLIAMIEQGPTNYDYKKKKGLWKALSKVLENVLFCVEYFLCAGTCK